MKDKKLKLKTSELVPGLYVDLELSWKDHPFLFRSFKIRSQRDINIIQGLGLETVTVYPGRSDIKVPKPAEDAPVEEVAAAEDEQEQLWDEKRNRIEKASYYRLRRQKVYNQYKESAKRVKRFTQNLQQAPANAVRDAAEIIDDMAAAFEQDGNVLMNLINLSSADFSLYHHALNVTVLSLSLGSAMGMRNEELRHLGMGAVLHDVGKIAVPVKILHKKGKLTHAEQGILDSHPLLGTRLAQRIQDLPKIAVDAIEKHHELLDGSGYPRGKDCGALSIHAQIVAIANLYDNLCNPADSSHALTPKSALAVLYAKYRERLDSKLIERFVHTLGVYPPGTVVRLSDDSVGLVVTVDPQALLRPTVLLYNPDIPKTEALMIDLQQYPDLEVADVLKPGDYPARIYDYLGVKERVGYFFEERP
ncbi:HD-GYP domain-containing protein [Mangrovitalea sediminis]|uniref:HD-GYP domain-containing protein n=1 Tax=Mangrovitalea sediminis TaxID=1982043 RepID=UPI000BE4F2EC|nr:HD-GYP domain-containing protein [Mangrovitalea sediminis]